MNKTLEYLSAYELRVNGEIAKYLNGEDTAYLHGQRMAVREAINFIKENEVQA
jgi:hypothetical protein